MSYTEEITQSLIDTLSRTAGLPTFQLAGHVPNLSFWMAEVRHAISVIEGYPKRFQDMVAAQNAFDAHDPVEARSRATHEYDYAPLKMVIGPARAEHLTRDLMKVANRLIDRCLKEGLLAFAQAVDLRAAMTNPNM